MADARRTDSAVVRVGLDAGPTGVAYGHHQVWVTRDDGTVVRLARLSGRVLGKTKVGRFPVRLTVGRSVVWVVDNRTGTLSRLDARTGRLQARIHVCGLPSGVAASRTSVWVICALGQLVRVDAGTNRVVARSRPGS